MTILSRQHQFCIRCQQMTAHYLASDDRCRCCVCGNDLDRTQEKRGLFHHLWGVAGRCAGYVKAEWQHAAKLFQVDED